MLHMTFSSCGEWGLLSGTSCTGFSLRWLLLLQSAGLVVPGHVGSFWTRDQSHVPCTGRQITLNPWTTREVPKLVSFFLSLYAGNSKHVSDTVLLAARINHSHCPLPPHPHLCPFIISNLLGGVLRHLKIFCKKKKKVYRLQEADQRDPWCKNN